MSSEPSISQSRPIDEMVLVGGERKLSPRFAPATFRAAWWTIRSLHRARRELRRHGVRAQIPPPPTLPWGAGRGVNAVLRRQEPTCLERSLVMQAWLAAQGERHDVIVGVNKTESGLDAHAWVDFPRSQPGGDGYDELVRLPPP